MWNAVVDTQLHHLRVDEQQLYLLRSGVVEHTDNQRVDADRFTGAGRACNQGVWHLGKVRYGDLAGNISAQRHRQRAFCLLKFRRVDDLPDGNGADHLVGHLDAHRRFVRDGRFDADSRGGKVEGDVIGKVGNLADFHPCRRLQFIAGNRRSACNVDDAGLHAEALQGGHQLFGVGAQLLLQVALVGFFNLI